MIKTYTEDIRSTEGTTIAIVGMNMFNPGTIARTASAYIYDSTGNVRSQLMEMNIEPKETVFLNTKIFLSGGDELRINGVDFTIAGDES